MSSRSKAELIACIEEAKASKAQGCRVPQGWGTSNKNLTQLQALLDTINAWRPKLADVVLSNGERWVKGRITNAHGVMDGFVLVNTRGEVAMRGGVCTTVYKQVQSATVYPASISNVSIAESPPAQSRKKRARHPPSSADHPTKKVKSTLKVEKEEKEREEKHRAQFDTVLPSQAHQGHRKPAKGRVAPGLQASPRKVALVIGCSQYLRHTPLRAAKTDAEQMFIKLRDLGYDATVQIDPTNLLQSFTSFFVTLHPNDSVLIYFAGHAGQKSGVNHLMPVDGRRQVSLSELHDQLKHKKLHRLGFIIDACRDEEGARRSVYSDWKLPDAANCFFSFACGPYASAVEESVPASDGRMHGRYTRALLSHMNAVDDIQLIMRRVCATVSEISDGKQRPWHHECIMIEESKF